MFTSDLILLDCAVALTASAALLLIGAGITLWRDFGARIPQRQVATSSRHITQLPRLA